MNTPQAKMHALRIAPSTRFERRSLCGKKEKSILLTPFINDVTCTICKGLLNHHKDI
jgi:hypothetical protein